MRMLVLLLALPGGLFFFDLACLAATKPNVLIITVDDMSADSLGSFGCKLPDTSPNIDRLASQGMRFNRAHVVVGNCFPSRNVMWSGLYGIMTLASSRKSSVEIDPASMVHSLAKTYIAGIRALNSPNARLTRKPRPLR